MSAKTPEKSKIEQLSAELVRAKRQIESLERSKRRVGLSFHRIPESGYQISRLWEGDFPYLQKIPSCSLEKPLDDSTFRADANTVLIEADNLAALMTMQLTHSGKIDVIYIDPPYNTGNEDFIYNDARKSSMKDIENTGADYEQTLDGKSRVVGKDDPERHSLWLSFMERRLWLAKNLLSEKGVIFISIDDNEQARLKLLMDSIFGEENFLNQFVWLNNLKGRQISNLGAAKTYEYIITYAKDINKVTGFEIPLDYARQMMPMVYGNKEYELKEDNKGKYVIKNELHNTNSIFNEKTRPNLVYNIHYNAKTRSVKFSDLGSGEEFEGFVKIEPYKNNDKVHKYHAWRWSRNKVEAELEDLEFIGINNTYKIYTKIRNFSDTYLKDIITNIGGGKIEGILGRNIFNFPKPINLIKILLKSLARPNAIVLDFFAGSGTTAHAVAELNKEDGGNRQCILITHGDENGKNIAADITAERMKRVLSGKDWADGKEHEPLLGSLFYYKLLFAPRTTNPLTAMETMSTRFTGIASLEQDSHVQLENTANYTILMNSKKIVIVWKNEEALLDEPAVEFIPLMQRLKLVYPEYEHIVYTPSNQPSDDDEYGAGQYGWVNYSYPMEYLQDHANLLERMKKNKTMLQPFSAEESTSFTSVELRSTDTDNLAIDEEEDN
jgi:DNA modification methylase